MDFAIYESSSAQKRIFLLKQSMEGTTAYNLPFAMLIEGKIDLRKFNFTFTKLINRHESLRTAFEFRNGKIVQKVYQEIDFTIKYREGNGKSYEELIQEFIKPFDVSIAPLLRVELIYVAANLHLFLFDIDHLITDGFSNNLLLNEIISLYSDKELPEVEVQYVDFTMWQNDLLQSAEIKTSEKYWMNVYSGEIPVLNLPTDFPRPARMSHAGSKLTFKIDEELTARLRESAGRHGVTLFMYLFAVFNILIQKYTDQEDIIVGTPIHGRQDAELLKTVGFFVNTLALRNFPAGEKSFAAFLQEVKESALQAYAHQDYQFEMLVEKLNLGGNVSRNPLFDILFALNKWTNDVIDIAGLKFTNYPLEGMASPFDLHIDGYDKTTSLVFDLFYSTRLFKRETMQRFVSHFLNILTAVLDKPELSIGEIDMLSKEEKEQIFREFNRTEADFPVKTYVELFAEQVRKTPERTAVSLSGKELTYRALNTGANQVAHLLQDKGLKREGLAVILTERTIEMLQGILGVFKAGGAYIPVDIHYPVNRIKTILQESGAEVILTTYSAYPEDSAALQEICADTKVQNIIYLDGSEVLTCCPDNLPVINQPEDLSYIIYTSGSTGKPKGAMVEHIGMVNHLFAKIRDLQITEEVVVAQNASHCFDISVWQFLVSLICGGRTVIYSNELTLDPEKFIRQVGENQVSILEVVPSFLSVLLDELELRPRGLSHLRYLVVTGETLKPNLVERWFKLYPHSKMVNAYGPTEASDDITHFILDGPLAVESIPVGSPVQNFHIYIVNKEMQLCPVGVKGEICVSGLGVGRGYLHNPEKTREVFLPDPFVTEKGRRMYKTGDLGRYLPDGSIEFFGRKDYQVKIRGFRIELGEIEKKLVDHPGVKEAVVMAKEDEAGLKYLCAYVVPNGEWNVLAVKSYLGENLPEYMVPAFFVPLPALPLNPNGKIDRKALPEPDGTFSAQEFIAPRDEVEEQLAAIWREILETERVGVYDSFFELGGHSLRVTQLASRIYREFAVEIPLLKIFNIPTINQIGAYIKAANPAIYLEIPQVEEREYYPLSSVQKRLFVLHQFDQSDTSYNIPEVMVLKGKLDQQRFRQAVGALIKRHESLRTSFEFVAGLPVQRVRNEVDFTVSEFQASEAELPGIIEKFIQPFNLREAPLLRVGYVECGEKEFILFDIHHIVADGLSTDLLVGEFMQLYRGQKLEDLRIQYKDFAVWQQGLLLSEKLQSQEAYWLHEFAGPIPVLNLPTDYPRPAVKSFAGGKVRFDLNPGVAAKLDTLSANYGVTLYMTLLAAFNALLLKYTGADDIIIGTPIAGRHHPDMEKIIGNFVNTLAMRNQPAEEKTFAEFLSEVRETALAAYENQLYQFEMLVDKLNLERDRGRHPLFDVMFALQNNDNLQVKMENLEFKPYEFEHQVTKFDLNLNAFEGEGKLSFVLHYSTRLFKQETVERLSRHFLRILEQVAETPALQMKKFALITAAERAQILLTFNATETPYPAEKPIHQIFAEQVQRTPDKIALVFKEKKLTFKELQAEVAQIAGHLRAKTLKREEIVGIMVERSVEMVSGILGILQAGGAFLPIDPGYPEDRIAFMLADSGARFLLTTESLQARANFTGEMILFENSPLPSVQADELAVANTPSDLAYVIYTSGSTGKPKGVLIEHQAIVNYMCWFNRKLNFNETDSTIVLASYSFDGVYTNFWAPLLTGGCLHIIEESVFKDPNLLVNYLSTWQITFIKGTPSLFNAILTCRNFQEKDVLKSIRFIMIGGEKVREKDLEVYKKAYPNTLLMNHYGPTEATIGCLSILLDDSNFPGFLARPVIGKPHDNMQAYILSGNVQPLPVGLAGELCIAGDGLARGYLNCPDLTADKFVENPFVPGKKMYRTGDLARWTEDGTVEFLGRIDDQVKIRGYRIELGEIEKQLARYPGIKEVVVSDRTDLAGDKYLCAYLVSTAELTVKELRRFLAAELPDYMIPTHFVQLAKIPLRPSGKVDIALLPEPDGSIKTGAVFVAPKNENEQKLAALVASVLGLNVEKVSIHDSLFDLGGNSLKLMTLTELINREYNLELKITDLFNYTTIEQLADLLSGSAEEEILQFSVDYE